MKRFLGIAIFLAVFAHAAVMLFGGLILNAMKQKQTARIAEVEILQEEKKEEKPKENERDVKKVEKVEDTPEDQMPDTTVLEEMDTASAAPALDAVSLADLESALSGGGGASDFARGVGFGSGGVIGGTGAPGGGGGLGGADGGSSGAMDQKPRLISSVNPEFPAALRKRGGSIVLLLFVNEQGRVSRVSVEKTSDPALEAPATEAARRWVFEPGTRGGKKAPFKTRQTIRLEAANT